MTAAWVAGLLRHLVPWVLLLLVLAAGAGAHAAWGSGPALPWITSAMTPVVGGLAWLAWTVARARQVGPAGRAHVAGTVAVAGLWLLAATVVGPLERPVLDLWGFLGAVGAVSWNLRLALHRPASSRRDEEDDLTTPRKAGRALMASVGMRGTELHPNHVDGNRVSGALELASGQHTVDDAQKRAGQLAAALEVPRGGVRFTEDPNNAGRGEFSFTVRDVLATATPWPGPSAVGGTVFDLIPMGVYETGAVMSKTVADKSGAKHELIQGTTGAGKSSGSKVEVCELMTRREVGIIVVDTVKGIQTFGAAARGLAGFITSEPLAKRFMKRLMVVIKAHTDYLGARDLTAWVPGCGLTFLVVQLEEAGILLEELGDEFKNVVKAARSAGIAVKVSLQRPSHDEMPTTARAQLGSTSCYGMGADDPVCMLPEAVQDAGADPRRWGDRQPGCVYIAGTGIAVAQAATPLRTYDVDGDAPGVVMARVAGEFGPRMTPLSQVTIAALGDVWRDMVPPVELVERTKAAALPGAGRSLAVVPDEIDQVDDDQGVGHVTEEDMGVSTPDPDPKVTGSIDDELESVGADVEFGPARSEVSPEVARRAVADRLGEIEHAGRDTVRVPDFSDLVSSGLRSRGWFRKELLRLVGVGRLVDEGDGVFRIVPGVDTQAA
ncbi:MAG: hypothetical protein ACRDRK_01905 [Pseudonocardia sp.]